MSNNTTPLRQRPKARQKVRFLTAIWGVRYVEEFARVSLPSYLAPGNIPALARETDVEVVVLTTRESREAFESNAGIAKLKSYCPIRYVYIDDLITNGNYGVTLTIAYARGIAASGPDQTSTYFIFMNSDFVLSDGSLRNLARRMIDEGRSCYLAASLRARAEAAYPLLLSEVNREDGTLTMSSRDMVRLALDHLHGTVVAKTISQSFVTCATHNQMYWQVDRNTLFGRNHLIFMLAIKPERPIGRINSYCDYGFVPELVPSGDFAVISDSDEVFLLEMQPESQELEFLRCGIKTKEEIAAELSQWTTDEHRKVALFDTYFHSEDLPPNLDAVRAEADEFIRSVQDLMEPPLSHVDHYYWVGGVESWILRRKVTAGSSYRIPPELDSGGGNYLVKSVSRPRVQYKFEPRPKPTFADYMRGVPAAVNRRLFGAKPDLPMWHHEWQDCRLLWRWLDQLDTTRGSRNLLVWDDQTYLPRKVRHARHFVVCNDLEDFFHRRADPDPARRLPRADEGAQLLDGAAVYMRRSNVKKFGELLHLLADHVRADAPIALYIDHPAAEQDASNFSVELAQYVQHVFPDNWLGCNVTASFVGGLEKRQLAMRVGALNAGLKGRSVLAVPKMVGSLVGLALANMDVWRANMAAEEPSERCPDWCTSALIVIRPKVAAFKAERPVDYPPQVTVLAEKRAAS